MGFRRRGTILKHSSYDSDADAYFNELTGPIPDAFKSAINVFVKGLKSDGNWSLIDRATLTATPISQNSTISIKNPTSTPATDVNAPLFTSNMGITGDGVTSYRDTKFNANLDGVNYTTNSASYGAYVRNNINGAYVTLGVSDNATTYSNIAPRLTDIFFASVSNAINNQSANNNSEGFFSVAREDANTVKTYKNGVLQNTDNLSAVVSVLNKTFFCLASNGAAAELFSAHQISFYYFGSGLIDQNALYFRLQTLATTLGFNV